METDVERVVIGPHLELLSGFAFPSVGFHESEGLPLVRIRDLGGIKTETRYRGRYDEQFIVCDGDVLVGMDGDFLAVRWAGGPALLNQRVCKVGAKAGGALDDGFLFHILQPSLDEIHRRTPQTTVRHLATKAILGVSTFLPPLPEQRRIAEILDTLDEAIRKTEEVIAKLQQMKQGLLHDLLTRGIDENGELRDPERHPEQFTDSPLGRVPDAWRLLPLVAVIEPGSVITYGVVQPGPRVEKGILFVRGGDFPDGKIVGEKLRTISQAVDKQYVRTKLRGGEVLVSLVGQPGSSAVVPQWLAGANIARQVALVRPASWMKPFFLRSFIASSMGQRGLLSDTLGSVQQVVNLRDLRDLRLPVPPIAEQERIESATRAIDRRLDEESRVLGKLDLVRRGLMRDLLSGHVRVPVSPGKASS